MGENRTVRLAAGFVAAWASVLLASMATALELVVSGTSPLVIALPAMTAIHTLIGIGEGVITAAVLSFVLATRRDLLELSKV
jgi:cobalt/nickel transport system permease protein